MVRGTLQLCFLFSSTFPVYSLYCTLSHCSLALLRIPADWWPVSVEGSLDTPSAPSSPEIEGTGTLYISLRHQVISGCKWKHAQKRLNIERIQPKGVFSFPQHKQASHGNKWINELNKLMYMDIVYMHNK